MPNRQTSVFSQCIVRSAARSAADITSFVAVSQFVDFFPAHFLEHYLQEEV